MSPLNTWISGLASNRQALIQHWDGQAQKALFQMLTVSKQVHTKQDRVLYRIALAVFKKDQSGDLWKEWLGERQEIEAAFKDRYKKLETQKERMRQALMTKSREVTVPLPVNAVDLLIDQYFEVMGFVAKWSTYSLSELRSMNKESLSTAQSLALAFLAMKKSFSITPYYTQVIAVLGALSEDGGVRGRVAQMKTGEGKTISIVLLAFVLAAKKRSVDIISSSKYLAMRDQKKYALFFEMFGILTAHICAKDKEKVNFDAHILYGMATDFEFALMKEKVGHRELFVCKQRERAFDYVIVDEVDNLLIDTALNSARISYPSVRRSKRLLYPLIYAAVQQPAEGIKELNRVIKAENIPISGKELLELMGAASTALKLKEGVDYIVDRGPVSNDGKEYAVKIIDHKNTGQVQTGMRWGHGMHEFLEVKHGIKLDKETITPIALSHVIFYDRYQKIFGFSGTIGSCFEREHIKNVYQVDTFDLPSYRPSLRKDFPVERFGSIDALRQGLVRKVCAMQKKGRPTLILCASIKETGEIEALFEKGQIKYQLYNELQKQASEIVVRDAGKAGAVTISTNNAGRGTDIVLSKEALQCGGLHVIFIDYPGSKRVEDQGIGRGGRQGQPGSSEILVVTDQTIEALAANRLEQEESHAKTLTRRAFFEREVHVYVDRFWEVMGEWKKTAEQKGYIERVIGHLTPETKKQAIAAVLGLSQTEGSFPFIVEALLSKVEGEVFQLWSETFFEPSERLMTRFQASEDSEERFKKTLAASFEKSQKLWMPFLQKDGLECLRWLQRDKGMDFVEEEKLWEP